MKKRISSLQSFRTWKRTVGNTYPLDKNSCITGKDIRTTYEFIMLMPELAFLTPSVLRSTRQYKEVFHNHHVLPLYKMKGYLSTGFLLRLVVIAKGVLYG